jgi:hypothetical protein
LIGLDYSLKLADFGFAAPISGWEGRGSGTNIDIAGTLYYGAPETKTGRPHAN